MPLDLSLKDKAVSGYMGRNLDVGALGLFLEAVRGGLVAPGSMLLIENIDRLGRNEPLGSMDTVRQIVNAGITIVTLQDGQRYSRESLRDLGHLIQLVAFASRAFEESHTKAKRVGSAWTRKRELARGGRPVTVRVPPWLKVEGARQDGTRRDFSRAEVKIVESRAGLVRQIFEWSANGWGYRRIGKELMARGVSPWGRNWSVSTISKLIKSRTVLGEWQPHIYVGGAYGKRTPDGPPIKGYFPAVVTEELWKRAQPKATYRQVGRSTGLLSGIVQDALGRPLHYTNGGTPRTTYLASANGHLGSEASAVRWRASHLEECVCKVIQGIDWQRVFSNKSAMPHIDELQQQIDMLDSEEREIQEKLAMAAKEFFSKGAFADALRAQAKGLEAQLATVETQRTTLQAELRKARQALDSGIKIVTVGVPKEPAARARANAEIRSIVKRIVAYPHGDIGDRQVRKMMLAAALERTSKRAELARQTGCVMAAIHLHLVSGQEITAYFTYVAGDRSHRTDLVGFGNLVGVSHAELSRWFSHVNWSVSARTAEVVTR